MDRKVTITVETMKLGQYDKIEKWEGEMEVSQLDDRRVQIGKDHSGLRFDPAELFEALTYLDAR